ncbi:hypothetical protein Acy02nite_91320 [Actinoplanes cyaneus]|uniref:Transposase n=1 Tax=Actinoplanes cyaneus TaxID=52696 RepID=A0A919IU11_9ACTN|nr:hypothetical protein Acy02nite_91320 [Actinoplanes cyaneus]
MVTDAPGVSGAADPISGRPDTFTLTARSIGVVAFKFGWLMQYRRLARDHEALPQRSAAMVRWAMPNTIMPRLTENPPKPGAEYSYFTAGRTCRIRRPLRRSDALLETSSKVPTLTVVILPTPDRTTSADLRRAGRRRLACRSGRQQYALAEEIEAGAAELVRSSAAFAVAAWVIVWHIQLLGRRGQSQQPR